MSKLSCRLVALALFALAIPLFASSPEYLVGTTAPTAAPLMRNSPAVASDGTDFFAVWHDGRSPGRSSVIGTRITREGRVLDPLGIRIATVPDFGYIWWPTVVWDGAAYVVVWTSEWSMYAARVDRDGRVVTAPHVIVEGGMTTPGRSAASNGSVTVIAYRGYKESVPTSYAVVLDRAGNAIHQEELAPNSPGFNGTFSVAATASRFVITWSTDQEKMWAVALGSNGRIAHPAKLIGTGENPAIASDGTRFVVVSLRYMQADSEWVLMGRTLDPFLANPGPVQPLASERVLESVSVFWRGSRYEVLAGHKPDPQTPYGLLSIELDRDGQKISSRRRGDINFYGTDSQPVAATNGNDVAVAFANPHGSFTTILGRVYRGSSPEPDVQELLSWSGNAHSSPDIVSSAAGHFAAWSEKDGAYATRIDANGNSIDGRGMLLSQNGYGARVAFDGTNYVVAWLDVNAIAVRWIAPATGATVAEAQIPAQRWWDAVALAVSPEATYVAYNDGRIRVTRIPHATRTPELAVAVSPEDMDVSDVDIAWNGTSLLVAWSEFFIGLGDPPFAQTVAIYAARVSAGLSLLDPAPLVVAPKEAEVSYDAPSVASNGDDWLVVSTRNTEVVGRRVLRSGNLEPVTKIADGLAGDVAWDGSQYAVVYREDDALYLGTMPTSLRMTRRTFVANEVLGTPSAVRVPNGDVAVIYTKLSFRPEHTGVERSYFRVMSPGGRGRVVRR